MNIESMLHLRSSLRQLTKSRAFTLPAIAGLAIAIGATTAVYSVFSTMMLQSMGFSETSRIVALWPSDEAHGQAHVEACYEDLIEWRKAGTVFEDVALASSVNLDFTLIGSGPPEHIDGTTVSGSFFRVLGAVPLAGRFFTDDDDRPGEPARVVLSYKLWKTRFGGNHGIVGQQVRLGADSATVIGIARPEFDFPRDVAVWAPLQVSWPTVEKNARFRVFRSIARLKPDVSPARAQASLSVITSQHERTAPAGSQRFDVRVTPILDEVYGAARPAVWILLSAVFLVLLIACANVANLLLARATERSREIAVRSVLGASRGSLIRLLLSESVVLALVAGAAGLLLASVGIEMLARLAPPEVPRIDQAAMNLPVLGFGIALTLGTVLLFGLAPAVIVSDRDPNETLKLGGTRSLGSHSHTALRRLLIGAEVALSALLLVGAGLLVRSFANLSAIDPGFRPERILTFRVTLDKPDQESRRMFYSDVLERMRALPGVESAGAVLIRPLSGTVGWDTTYEIEGQSPAELKTNPNGNYEAVSPDYFRTIGIRLLSGRDFAASDTHTATGVVIVNQATAKRHWPNGGAVGQHVRLNSKSPWLTVVGVVGDVRYREWEAVRPDFYIPYMQRAQHRSDFVVKTRRDPWAIAETVRREIFAIDKNQPISNVTTMEALVERALARSRFNSAAIAALAGCALVLAAIGIYGLLSYMVSQRRGEIGVRMAVGATPAHVARWVTLDAVRLVAAGAITGLALAGMASSLLASQLFGVTGFDPVSYAGAAIVLLVVAVAACAGPALRAASLDPARALQSQ